MRVCYRAPSCLTCPPLLQRDLQRAEKKSQSANEATAGVEGRLRNLQNTISQKENEFATQLRKVEERELQGRKELEATKSQLEAAEKRHKASEVSSETDALLAQECATSTSTDYTCI